jgi:hypothetical protein
MFTVCKDNLATVMLNKDSVGIKGREFIIYWKNPKPSIGVIET